MLNGALIVNLLSLYVYVARGREMCPFFGSRCYILRLGALEAVHELKFLYKGKIVEIRHKSRYNDRE